MSKDRDQQSYAFAKLKGTNYREWSRHMILALKEAELWRIVSDIKKVFTLNSQMIDSIEKKLKKDVIADYHMLDAKTVNKIEKMCTNNVQIKFFSLKAKWTSRDLWEHLKKRYSSTKWSFKWAAFNNLKMLSYESSIADLESKILNILIELKSQNLIIEQIVTLKILNILKSFFVIYLIVLMKFARKENKFFFLISLFQNLVDEKNRQRAENVINLIKRDEIKRNNQRNNKRKNKKNEDKKNDSNDENDSNDDKKCTRCDSVSHSKDECSTINSECFECHKIDHWRQMCRIKNKKNDQFNKKSSRRDDKIENESSITEEVTLMIKRLINEIESVESIESAESSELLVNSVNDHITRKILDSEVIDHIFCNRSNFISYTFKIFICETDIEKKFTAKNTESIQMKLIDDQNRSKLVILIEVLYSSQLQYNLISIIKLVKKKIKTLLSLLIKTFKLLMNDDVIAVDDIINNQYVLKKNITNSYRKNSIESELRALTKLIGLEIHIWHVRMRHLRYDNLIKLQNQIEEMNLIDQKSIEICESCMIDRQKRNVNKTSRISVSKFLEIVHSDLRRSLSRTRSEHAYYMTFRNNWSDVIWVHLLRNKNQAFEAFKAFQSNTERSSDSKIITLRGNNTSEYIDQKFQNYLIEQKINWNSRALYVPEQNDEAERLNRTLMYKIRLMLNDRKIFKNMWEEVIKTIAYLFNRSLHYQLNDKISYEIIKNKKSDLSHLRIIDSIAWMHIAKKKIKKLDDRFWKSILVSYESENQYRICDLRTSKIHIVRDVKIDEMSHIRDQFDSDSSDDDFWTHEDDKLLNSNFEIENSSISSRSRSKSKTVDNKVESSDLSENLDSVKAVESTNALNQMMKNLNLDAENHFENFSENFSADNDQTNEKISSQS